MKWPRIRMGLYSKKNEHGPSSQMITGPRIVKIKLFSPYRLIAIRFMYYNKAGTCWNLDIEI